MLGHTGQSIWYSGLPLRLAHQEFVVAEEDVESLAKFDAIAVDVARREFAPGFPSGIKKQEMKHHLVTD
ncbi:hypothetical protein CA85_49280 [Allorhodopirellula solitaria]|uniref:Uncharacterized protein n=1 Tax=Allorhodopirellula solitaria TaxID=2527987 RepID=A0A5C5X035_9BACT|nr:hypothetical protein CA85_49280 [Allorhodopirellula solitaria]